TQHSSFPRFLIASLHRLSWLDRIFFRDHDFSHFRLVLEKSANHSVWHRGRFFLCRHFASALKYRTRPPFGFSEHLVPTRTMERVRLFSGTPSYRERESSRLRAS